MGIKSFKPVTPSLRNTTVLTNEELTKFEPERKLLKTVKDTVFIKLFSVLQTAVLVFLTEMFCWVHLQRISGKPIIHQYTIFS